MSVTGVKNEKGLGTTSFHDVAEERGPWERDFTYDFTREHGCMYTFGLLFSRDQFPCKEVIESVKNSLAIALILHCYAL